MTHPIERASVEQADRLTVELDQRGPRTNGVDALLHRRSRNLIVKLLEDRQQARDAGFAEGVERAAGVADIFERQGYHSCQIAAAIRALSAEANEGRCDG